MTKNFSDLVTLLSCAITGNDTVEASGFCFGEIYSLAKAQQIHTIIFPVIRNLKEKQKITIDEGLYKAWEGAFFKLVGFSIQRNQYIGELIKRLDELGIKNCILKGQALCELYPVPDGRVSSDVDLFIHDKEKIPTVLDMLAKDGFRIGGILEDSHQIECRHTRYGLIEIHTDIYDDIAKNVWFENSIVLSSDFIKRTDGNGFYYTLPITDGAIYVTVHFLKHFLSHGCGVRQLTDMLLYLKKHEGDIDWQRFNALFEGLNYLKFIELCKNIGNRYFGMDFGTAQADETLCESILSDMEGGGVFGHDEEYRSTFTYHFTRLRSNSASHSQSRAKNFIRRCTSFAKERRYNVFLIIKDAFKKQKKQKSSASEINERLDLFRNLGFFEK